jgi:hypothetical protein
MLNYNIYDFVEQIKKLDKLHIKKAKLKYSHKPVFKVNGKIKSLERQM